MASNIKRRVALKGQSRSKFCGEPIRKGSKTPCLRLAGHKKAHRATTMRQPRAEGPQQTEAAPVVATAEVTAEGGIGEVVEQAPTATPKASKKRRSAKRRRLTGKQAGELAAAVEDGTVTASEALSRIAASQRGRRNKPVRVSK